MREAINLNDLSLFFIFDKDLCKILIIKDFMIRKVKKLVILCNIDGPKGSGKSTLSKELSDRLKAKVKYFDSHRVVTDEDFNLNHLRENLIFERGLFSYMIYGFIGNAQQSFDVDRRFNEIRIKTWTPLSEMHIDKLYENIEYYSIFLYASNSQDLLDRIQHRKNQTGKGATYKELLQLDKSNELFKLWGNYYKHVYPDKTLVYDVSAYQNIDDLVDDVMNEISKKLEMEIAHEV